MIGPLSPLPASDPALAPLAYLVCFLSNWVEHQDKINKNFLKGLQQFNIPLSRL